LEGSNGAGGAEGGSPAAGGGPTAAPGGSRTNGDATTPTCDDNDGLPGPRSAARSPSKRQTTMARVSPTLLAAVRARQTTAANTRHEATRDARRRALLASYLVEVFDAVRSVLSARKVSVMPLDTLVANVSKQMPRNCGPGEVEGVVHILVEAVPHWVAVEERTSVLNRGAGLLRLLRVDRTQDLSAVRKAVAAFASAVEEGATALAAVP